ncbi:hypothetical protein CDIK_0020 [Cucumispora dikerogammari]|nr:hypothetical protein CDIK_0020 [Cucumispora dikerogammari]
MDFIHDLKKDIDDMFSSSDSSCSVENIHEIVKNSDKIFMRSSLLNNFPIFDSDIRTSEEQETLKKISKDTPISTHNTYQKELPPAEDIKMNKKMSFLEKNINIMQDFSFNKRSEFVHFLNKFKVLNNKLVPLEYDNVYRHYGTQKGNCLFLDDWEVLHIFGGSLDDVLDNIKTLSIYKLKAIIKESAPDTEMSTFSKTNEKMFYKAYFALKERYNIINSRIYLRTKDFNRKEAIGIPVRFVEFKKPEIIAQKDTVYVVLNETEFVCLLVEGVVPNHETHEKLLKT